MEDKTDTQTRSVTCPWSHITEYGGAKNENPLIPSSAVTDFLHCI